MSGASVESASPRLRRTFTAADKRRIVKAAAVATASGERGAIEALLRKEGIYSSLLSAWRQQLAAGGTSALEPQKPGRKAKQLDPRDVEIARLRSELERAQHVLRTMDVRLELAIAGVAPASRQSRARSKKRRTGR